MFNSTRSLRDLFILRHIFILRDGLPRADEHHALDVTLRIVRNRIETTVAASRITYI